MKRSNAKELRFQAAIVVDNLRDLADRLEKQAGSAGLLEKGLPVKMPDGRTLVMQIGKRKIQQR
jgi:hypothetical protein